MPYKPFKPPDHDRDRQINPTWRCYCCHDTGMIANVRSLPGGEHYRNTDPSVVCRKPNCSAASRFFGGDSLLDSAIFEGRVVDCATKSECLDIHDRELEDWQTTARNQQRNIQAIKEALMGDEAQNDAVRFNGLRRIL